MLNQNRCLLSLTSGLRREMNEKPRTVAESMSIRPRSWLQRPPGFPPIVSCHIPCSSASGMNMASPFPHKLSFCVIWCALFPPLCHGLRRQFWCVSSPVPLPYRSHGIRVQSRMTRRMGVMSRDAICEVKSHRLLRRRDCGSSNNT